LAKTVWLHEAQQIVVQVGIEQFDSILAEHIRNSRWFPTVAELRQRAGMAQSTQDQIEANQAWEWIRWFATHNWHPDIGLYNHAPAIPPRIDYAMRQVGGLRIIAACGDAQLPFVRKDFMEAFELAPLAMRHQNELMAAKPKELGKKVS